MMKKKSCSPCFSLIGGGTRIKIIQQLRKNPQNVSEISANFSLTQPTISYHLKLLEKRGAVCSKKRGREIYYFLNKRYPCKKCSLFEIPLKP